MGFFYDRNGNIYKVEDESILKKRNIVIVYSEKGEEMELPADQADEYKLTPNEKLQVINEIKARVVELERLLGLFIPTIPVNSAVNPNIIQTQPIQQAYNAPVAPQPYSQNYMPPQYTAAQYSVPTAAQPPYGTPLSYGYNPYIMQQFPGRMR